VTREAGEIRVAEMPLPGPTPPERVVQVRSKGTDLLVTGGIGRMFRSMLEGGGTAVMPWVTGPVEAVISRLTRPRASARRISVSASAAKPDAGLEPCFGRAPFHGLFDPASGAWEFLPADPEGGTAELLLTFGVGAVVTGSIGPIATGVFRSGGVAVYTARSGTLEELVAARSSGRLARIDDDGRGSRHTLLATAGAGGRPGGRNGVAPAATHRKRKSRKVSV
jgi:predicted Fe-Mo cluster-binding NifX family protein